MCKEGEETKGVELEEDTDVSDTSVECFQPSLLLRQTKNCDEYHDSSCNFPGQNTGVGSHFLLQGIILIQGWNLMIY